MSVSSCDQIIVHFSQDFTYGKAQLGGYGRIFNTLDVNQRHIVYTVSNRDELNRINFSVGSGFEVRQMPAFVSTGSFRERLACARNVGGLIAEDMKNLDITPNILFGHSQLVNFYILNRVKRLLALKAPIIWEFNAIWGGINVTSLKNRLVVLIMRYFERKIVKRADALIFQTTAAEEWIQKLYGRAKGKKLIITNAVPESALSSTASLMKPSTPPKVLVNGLFDSMNGLGVLVEYLKRHPKPPVELHFYGSGPWGEELKSLSNGKEVVYHGPVPRDVMQEEYLKFDFHLIPRLKRVEADLFIPSKLLEAMAKGLVPIVSTVRGMTDVVEPEDGYIIEAGKAEALAKVFEEIVRLSQGAWMIRSERCRTKVRNQYIWGENHKKLANLYAELS